MMDQGWSGERLEIGKMGWGSRTAAEVSRFRRARGSCCLWGLGCHSDRHRPGRDFLCKCFLLICPIARTTHIRMASDTRSLMLR